MGVERGDLSGINGQQEAKPGLGAVSCWGRPDTVLGQLTWPRAKEGGLAVITERPQALRGALPILHSLPLPMEWNPFLSTGSTFLLRNLKPRTTDV